MNRRRLLQDGGRDGRGRGNRSRAEPCDPGADPSEMNNLAGQYPDVFKRLSDVAPAWQKTLPPSPIESRAGQNDYPQPGGK